MRDRRFLTWVVALLLVPYVFAWLLGLPPHAAAPPLDAPPVEHLAFWSIFVVIASAIWKAIEVAGRVTLAALAWSVKALWAYAVGIYNAAKAIGKGFIIAGHAVWQFSRWTYDNVLKPAWEKFWHLVDRVRAGLDKVFRPIFRFLARVRAELLKWYDRFIRPILDTIDLTRSILRAFGALGLDLARELDRKLGELETRISAPFDWLLAKVNELVTWVDRIVTADGFFQRLTLIRSLEKFKQDWIVIWLRAGVTPFTVEERVRRRKPVALLSPAEHVDELARAILHDDGPLAMKASEWVQDLELLLARTRPY
jgi:hypothetical protein